MTWIGSVSLPRNFNGKAAVQGTAAFAFRSFMERMTVRFIPLLHLALSTVKAAKMS